jgi:biotin synthase
MSELTSPVAQPIELFRPVPRQKAGGAAQRWPVDAVAALFELPFNDLIFRAQQVHREHFDANEVQLSTLLSIKTGGCEEDCGYCPQSVHYDTGVEATKLLDPAMVAAAARAAREQGASRFCMGAAWRAPKDRDIEKVAELVRVVKAEGLEACCTLGMLTDTQAHALKEAGLDYYNHNLDTAPEAYGRFISTRTYDDRLQTPCRACARPASTSAAAASSAWANRAASAPAWWRTRQSRPLPESVPINQLVQVEGTPLHGTEALDPFEFVRTIAVARITMPKARVRLSAGRQQMGEAVQALCFLAGANSIFYGDKLLTTGNPDWAADQRLLGALGIAAR